MNVKLLKQKDFFLLMLGKLVSFLGTQMQSVALSLYVFKLTGSATKFASVLAAAMIPQIILGPIAGVFTDWLDRKKIIVYMDILRGVIVGIYACIFITKGSLPLSSIYVLVIILTLASTLFQPAVSTVIPSIVKKEELVDANSINSVILEVGSLIAPALGCALYGIYGLLVILILNAVSFVASGISEMFINIPKNNKKPEKMNFKTFSNDFCEGFRFLKNKKLIFNIVIMAVVINAVFNPTFTIGLVYISKKIFFISDFKYGLMQTIVVFAAIIGSLLTPLVSKKMKMGKMLFLDMLVSSILIGIMAIIPSKPYLNLFNGNFIPYISIIVILFAINLIVTIGNVALAAMFQKEVPLSLMGRVQTVMSTGCMAAIPLGQMIYGILFDKLPAWLCILISAVILFISIMYFRKPLLECDKEEEKDLTSVKDSDVVVNEKMFSENEARV